MEFSYYNPVKLLHGEDKLQDVVSEIRTYGDKVLLITGGESFKRNGYYAELEAALAESGIRIYELSGNRIPSLARVREGIGLVREEAISCIVGIGGGTCIDIAKTIALGVRQSGDIWDYLTYRREPDTMEHLPIGTIITFPSSGSDMNGSAQITDDETGEQAGLSGVYPDFSWQNPRYMISISNKALTEAQMTAFVQLSLGYIGLGRSDIAEGLSLTLIRKLFENLDKSLQNPEDIEARGNLMALSAFTVNGLTTLGKRSDWCLYPINSMIQKYCGVHYKQAITIIFPYYLKLIYRGQEELDSYFHSVLGVDIAERSKDSILKDGLSALFALYRKYGIPTCFSEIHEVKENIDCLSSLIDELGNLQSVYTELDNSMIITMINEAVRGI